MNILIIQQVFIWTATIAVLLIIIGYVNLFILRPFRIKKIAKKHGLVYERLKKQRVLSAYERNVLSGKLNGENIYIADEVFSRRWYSKSASLKYRTHIVIGEKDERPKGNLLSLGYLSVNKIKQLLREGHLV